MTPQALIEFMHEVTECGIEMRRPSLLPDDTLEEKIAYFLDWEYPNCDSVEQGAQELAEFIGFGTIPDEYKKTGRVGHGD